MFENSVWEINGLQKEFEKATKTSTTKKDDDDGDSVKVLIPN